MSDTGGYHAFTQRSSGRASEIQTEVKLRLGSSIAQQFGLSQETEVGGAAVWDTGAPFSVVSSRVIGGLALEPLGFVRLVGVGGSEYVSGVYMVDFLLPALQINNLRVAESPILGQIRADGTYSEDMLIGMDIINQGDFAITNAGGQTAFSFRYPSARHHIDFLGGSGDNPFPPGAK